MSRLVGRWPACALIPLAIIFSVMGLVEAWRDSPTVDETVDLASGVTALVRRDLGLAPEHGVLTKVLPALPALAGQPVVPDGPGYKSGNWFDHTDEFVRANTAAGRLHRVVFLSRLVSLIESLAIAGVLYLLGARLFGPWPGVLSSALWLTTPVFVGFGHVAGVDIPFTLATLLVSLALARFLDAPSNGRAVVVGVACGAALLTRHLALVLVGVGCAVVLAFGWKRARDVALRHAGIVASLSWITVWVVIRLLGSPPGGAGGARLDGIVSAGRGESLITRVVLSIPWPREWGAGLAYLVLTSSSKAAYLFGHAWNGGRWWYFLAAVPLKVPLVALVVLVAGPFLWRRAPTLDVRKAVAVIVLPAVGVYAALAAQPLNLGLRYAFPVLALWFVAAGPAALMGRRAMKLAAVGALTITQAAALLMAYPHSIAWTAPPFQPAYRWATDSNVDYGQDADRVRQWSLGKAPFEALLLPRGVDAPEGSRPLLQTSPDQVHGWVAVSATRLTALDRDALSWLRAYCPVRTIGGSVLIYRFESAVDPRPGPTMPAAPCAGGVSTRRP